jgi:diadenosine tetraphosphate (Ap4A) HIT family hydrolase
MTTIFTRIIDGQIPGTFVHKDEACVAFMSINPMADGHVLVIPRDEVEHWVDLSPYIASHLFEVSHRISRALSVAFPCEKVGLIIAGYEVNHSHIHLIPTTHMGQLSFANAAASVERSTLEAHAEKIIAVLASL